MVESETATRYGMEMDLTSARLMDRLDDEFDDLDDWVIDDRYSMIKSDDRSVTIECVNPRVIDNKIARCVFDAFRNAGLQVNSTLRLSDTSVRIWYEERDPSVSGGVLVDSE